MSQDHPLNFNVDKGVTSMLDNCHSNVFGVRAAQSTVQCASAPSLKNMAAAGYGL